MFFFWLFCILGDCGFSHAAGVIAGTTDLNIIVLGKISECADDTCLKSVRTCCSPLLEGIGIDSKKAWID